MPLLKTLYDTYKCMTKNYSTLPEDLRKYYISAKPAFCITIDLQGNFVKFEQNNKKNIYMPCTEKSAGRTSGVCANPLFDKICYLIDNKSFANFISVLTNNNNQKNANVQWLATGIGSALNKLDTSKFNEYVDDYTEQMNNWISNETNNDVKQYLNAIVSYIEKRTLLSDLNKEDYLTKVFDQKFEKCTNPNKKYDFSKLVDEAIKIITDFFIEFEVIDSKIDIDSNELYDSWCNYYESLMSNQGSKIISALSGDLVIPATGYPKKIRHDGDQTKLISANDKHLVYLGRFTSEKDISQIGLAENQEIHLILSKLMREASVNIDSQYTAIWGISANNKVETNIYNYMNKNMLSALGISKNESDNSEVKSEFKVDFRDAILGKIRDKEREFGNKGDKIYILTVDSATSGRLSVTRFWEKDGSEYFQNVKNWLDDTFVKMCKTKEYYSPNLFDIAHIIYGKQDKNISKKFYDQISDAIINCKNIPIQYINALVTKVKNNAHEDNIYFLICKACSFIRCFYKRNNRGDLFMLDKTCNNRSYLFGRLLAIADNIENFVNQSSGVKRSTTAMRLLSICTEKPASSWANIEKSISPYIQRLESSEKDVGFISSRKKLLDEVMGMLSPEDFKSQERLESLFLLGFHHQRAALFNSDEGNK